MKVLSVIGMIVGILFIVFPVLSGVLDPYKVIVDQAIYIVGGSLLFLLSALLNTLHSLKDAIDDLNSNYTTGRNQEKGERPKLASAPSKYYATDFEGIPRKLGETSAEYWDRVEKESTKQNQPFPR